MKKLGLITNWGVFNWKKHVKEPKCEKKIKWRKEKN